MRLRLIDRGPRKAKLLGGSGQRTPFDLDGAQQLIFNLKQIVGVEKRRTRQTGMTHLFGGGIEGAALPEGLKFLAGILGYE